MQTILVCALVGTLLLLIALCTIAILRKRALKASD